MEKQTVRKKKIKRFHGMGSLIASEMGCTPQYCRRVLSGEFDDKRHTDLVVKIKKRAFELSEHIK